MRISDWSSDVCSSDLPAIEMHEPQLGSTRLDDIPALDAARARFIETEHIGHRRQRQREAAAFDAHDQRSEERRVGKECVSTCRSRVRPYTSKKQQMTQRKPRIRNKQTT